MLIYSPGSPGTSRAMGFVPRQDQLQETHTTSSENSRRKNIRNPDHKDMDLLEISPQVP